MQETWLTHYASAAAADTIYVSRGRAWQLPNGSSIARPLEVGPGIIIDVVGHPDRYEVVAALRHDDQCELRLLNIATGEMRIIHRAENDMSILGWAAANIIVVALDDGQSPISTIIPVCLTPSTTTDISDFPKFTQLNSIDYAPDGAMVATTGTVNPSTWRAYRGGGQGRILIWRGQSFQTLPALGNAANAVVMDARIYYLDDSHGSVDVYSVPVDGDESPQRHTWFAGLGGVSLRRGERHLVIGTPGQAYALDPRNNDLRRLAGPSGPASFTTPKASPLAERAVLNHSATYLAVCGAGRLTVIDRQGTPDWLLSRGYGWVVDVDWSADSQLVILVRSQSEYSVLKLDPDSKVIQAFSISGADGIHIDNMIASATEVIISSSTAGIAVVNETSGIRWITQGWSYRRSRPRLSRDGRYITWTEASSHQGARLHVANLTTGEIAILSAAGQDLTAPTFDLDGRLLFLSRQISPIAGTASPLTGKTLVCRVLDDGPLLDHVHRGRTEVVHRESGVLHGLVEHDGLWLRSSRELRRLEGPRSSAMIGSPVGDDRSPITCSSSTSGSYLHIPGVPDPVSFPTPKVQPHHARDVLDQVFHLLKAHNLGEVPQTVQESVLSLACYAHDAEDLSALVTAVVRQVGRSHATVIRQRSFEPRPSESTKVALLQERTASQLPDGAAYLWLPDVSSRGVQLVEKLCRTWSGSSDLVLDLRYNSGGQFADHLHALLSTLLSRRTVAISPYGDETELISGPSRVYTLVNEYTGSGGEHLAALLSNNPKVAVVGRRTLGAGTAFHQTWVLTADITLTLPQYHLRGYGPRNNLENRGLEPQHPFVANHAGGIDFDQEMISSLFEGHPNIEKTVSCTMAHPQQLLAKEV